MKCLLNGKWPCGKCAACLHNKVEDWKFRLEAESENSPLSLFLTLTYADEHLPHFGVSKTHLQSFFKMLRSKGLKFKYYAISEYGPTTFRPHYHILMFFDKLHDYDQIYDQIHETWRKGNICLDVVNKNRIQYVANYHVTKGFSPREKARNFKLSSQNLGESWLTDNRLRWLQNESNGCSNYLGYRMRLPRYIRDKALLFDNEKERMLPPQISDSVHVPCDFKNNFFLTSRFHCDVLEIRELKRRQLEVWNKRVLRKIFNKKNKI